MFHKTGIKLLVVFISIVVIGCGDDNKSSNTVDPDPGNENNPGENIIAEKSTRPDLKFKDYQRLSNDLALILNLPPTDVCNELGLYSCLNDIHKLVLKGTSPYDEGRYEPIERFTVSAPIALQRVALSACSTRVELDLSAPESSVLLKPEMTLDNRINNIYQLLLKRNPTNIEVEKLKNFEREVALISEATLKDWTVGACLALLSSSEYLFY